VNKVLICPYFGDLPPWMDRYWENAARLQEHGYDFLLETDEDAFRDRVRDLLAIEPPVMAGTGNIWDFRPALGYLYEDEIKDFHYWGHTDFDCVYGRVERFYPDELLGQYDILTDHWDYICGPWTLYRNTLEVRELFIQNPEWVDVMSLDEPQGWPEFGFNQTVKRSGLKTLYACHHEWRKPELLKMEDGILTHDKQEIPMFHFRHTKRWPL